MRERSDEISSGYARVSVVDLAAMGIKEARCRNKKIPLLPAASQRGCRKRMVEERERELRRQDTTRESEMEATLCTSAAVFVVSSSLVCVYVCGVGGVSRATALPSVRLCWQRVQPYRMPSRSARRERCSVRTEYGRSRRRTLGSASYYCKINPPPSNPKNTRP